MKILMTFFLGMVAISAMPAHASEAIVNYENQAIKRLFDAKTLSLEEVQKAIREAAAKLNWRVEPGDQGHIIATLLVRQHTAVVDIAYSQTSYGITYKSSINLVDKMRSGPVVKNGQIMGASKNSEFAQMQGAENISPRRICMICKQEIFSATQRLG